jgi:hypothetical protein
LLSAESAVRQLVADFELPRIRKESGHAMMSKLGRIVPQSRALWMTTGKNSCRRAGLTQGPARTGLRRRAKTNTRRAAAPPARRRICGVRSSRQGIIFAGDNFRSGCDRNTRKESSMKLIAIVLGLASLAVAAAYLLLPAGALPGFFPGFEAGSDHVHVTHGLASLAGAVVLFGFAWWRGRTE